MTAPRGPTPPAATGRLRPVRAARAAAEQPGVRRVAIAATAMLAVSAAAAPAPTHGTAWQRTWTVAGVTGRHAGAAGLDGIVGQPVVLAPDRAESPVGEPCPNTAGAAPDYTDMRTRPRAELPRHFGAFWRWPAALGRRPVFGWVRCGRTNLGAFAFADAGHGYLFFEDGLVIVLR